LWGVTRGFEFSERLSDFVRICRRETEVATYRLIAPSAMPSESLGPTRGRAPGYRQALIQLLGGKCATCGGLDELRIHHIDGNPANAALENLKVLCGKCHGPVHPHSTPNKAER
jgi:5-methylcytosine-specific restriction endonuclease McrA